MINSFSTIVLFMNVDCHLIGLLNFVLNLFGTRLQQLSCTGEVTWLICYYGAFVKI